MYRLEMSQVCQDNRQHQLWLYRYDCIVNAAYPEIALQRCSKTNKLVISHFSGAECQIIDAQLVSEEQETYKLVTEDIPEVLLSSGTAAENARSSELADFNFVPSSNDQEISHWHLLAGKSAISRRLLRNASI